MLISVKENVFKKEVEIKFNNITEGFNRYKNKTISAINEENFERGMICFLEEAVKLNGLNSSYVDFYYNSLSEEDKVKLVEMVSVDDRKFIESFKEKNTTGGIYYYLTLDSVPFISRTVPFAISPPLIIIIPLCENLCGNDNSFVIV